MEFFHFSADNVAGRFHLLHIPGLGEQSGNRDCRTVLIIINCAVRPLRGLLTHGEKTAEGIFSQAGNDVVIRIRHKMLLETEACGPVCQGNIGDGTAADEF